MATTAAHDLDIPPAGTAGSAHPDHTNLGNAGVFNNMIEWVDEEYKKHEDKTFAARPALPMPADHLGWRAWEQAEMVRKGVRPVLAKRFRPELPIKTTEVWASYGEGGTEKYRMLVHSPEGVEGLKPAVLWFHGGGWSHGCPEMDAARASYVASELRAVVFNIDYRLIPEITWPKNHDDCYHSISWVIEHAEEWGVDKARLALWGGSAGAHLGAGAALRDAREHNPSRIRQVNLVVPVTFDLRAPPPPFDQKAREEMAQMPPEVVQQFLQVFRDLTGSDEPSKDPYFNPLLAPIPPHHPQTVITVAGLDRLRDQGIAYHLHLRSYGVDTQLEVVPGVPHAFTGENESEACKGFWRGQVRGLEMGLGFDWTK